MKNFVTFALALFACIAVGHCNPPYAPSGPSVQLVRAPGLTYDAIERLLSGASSSSAAASSAASPAAQIISAAPAYPQAPAPYVPLAPRPVAPLRYGPAPPPARGLNVSPAYALQLYPGQENYKTYASPPQYSTVALPVVPASPVARVFVPRPAPPPAYHPSYPAPPRY